MIPHTEALSRLLAPVTPVGTEIVSLAQSSGRIVARTVQARVSNPPADVSAMDGYAVRSADSATVLRVVGTSRAGEPFSGTVHAAEAVRIFTGSIMPEGADAVLIQENARLEGGTIVATAPVPDGSFVRRAGQDFAAGQDVVQSGACLNARAIGLLAAAGHVWVEVRRRPRVALLTTGDELSLPGDPLPPGGIYNSNGPMLSALVHAAGAEPVLLPPLPDSREDVAAVLAGLRDIDLVISMGGASVGAHDVMRDALSMAGFAPDFWTIAMRPGKPLMHARKGSLSCIGLPGNPVAALVCGIVFVLPVIARLQGRTSYQVPTESATLGCDLGGNDMRFDHLRARLTFDENGDTVATPFSKQDSGMLSALSQADALVLRPSHAPAARAGERCRIIRLAPLGL
ncbi:molybdopterin biosynthesis protein MoeA [Ameyamaea chiangmaiensis NBRC 103196]|uniref:Molybdopterin molybdenumtransferase n=1 Tax=Ameyamaea chiangmaiensis TaxID=442969 RepID=A0A850PCW2_9PROT|nr:gephyrin-like molybdotransferase Glp [Ameyamaea chiangmaiensis]MBS4073716.1 molybdopterin molybdotransferase MoeA [Ameyamaea chiangmaiensis]NVN39792.1 molybdopterin molybdotransferase MoeA [Ameyamaea chiangmaiensis]GBQ68714.1 molybdopterin biosynthesis protein MoeA [Ameyamaea chiangmaiensis NBRC 103196]